MRITLVIAAVAGVLDYTSAQCENPCVEYCGCESYHLDQTSGIIHGYDCSDDCQPDDTCGDLEDCRVQGWCNNCLQALGDNDPCNECLEYCGLEGLEYSATGDFCQHCASQVCYQTCVDAHGSEAIDAYIAGGCVDTTETVISLFELPTPVPENCYPIQYSCGGSDFPKCSEVDIVGSSDGADHCCGDEEYCCDGGEDKCGPGSDQCGYRYLCYGPYEYDMCDPDDSKCRTDGDDCWGAENEPQECADGYIPAIDYTQDKLLCFPPGCPSKDIHCEHDESKCRTDGDDCYGANHEPQECADGYQPLVNWEENYLYCFPPACAIAYNNQTMDCRDCSTEDPHRHLLFARLPCC